MAKSRPSLDRLLNAPDLERIVPRLQPEVLHRVIQICGLEDCAEFVALATPDQLARILDVDLWRARAGGDDELDINRFGVWLDVLMQSGARVAAQKLVDLDIGLIVAGFARHTAVFEHTAVSSYMTLDGEQMPGRAPTRGPVVEIGGYVIEARCTSAWDTIVDLLAFLDSEYPEYFRRLMRGCVRLSNGIREADGFHNLLPDRDQEMSDLSRDREERRERQGYVTPAQGRAFLEAARQLHVASDQPPASAAARAYFRGVEPAPRTDDDPSRQADEALLRSNADAVPPLEGDVIVRVADLLREAGVLKQQPRVLLESGRERPSRLALIRAYVECHAASAGELAYLANTIMAGCSIQGRPFTTREASDAAAAICNLGLDNWPAHWRDCDLVTAFQVGWTILHRDICLFTAERLIDVLADIRCADRNIQLRLHALRGELSRQLRNGTPWRAGDALDAILMLDAPAWAVLRTLIDECPAMHAAIRASPHSRRAINAEDFEFISENSEVAVVREFLESLPSTLTR